MLFCFVYFLLVLFFSFCHANLGPVDFISLRVSFDESVVLKWFGQRRPKYIRIMIKPRRDQQKIQNETEVKHNHLVQTRAVRAMTVTQWTIATKCNKQHNNAAKKLLKHIFDVFWCQICLKSEVFWVNSTQVPLHMKVQASSDYPYAWHLHGRKRLWEIRVQMRLKQAGNGNRAAELRNRLLHHDRCLPASSISG